MKRAALVASLAAALLAGCSNAPPFLASGLSAPSGKSGFANVSMLANYGELYYEDGQEVARDDGKLLVPEYYNLDFLSAGKSRFQTYSFYSLAMVNFQLQASGGFHWRKRAALAYFPTVTLSGKNWLHGLQMEVRLPMASTASLSLYEENLPSILPTVGLYEAGPVKLHRVAAFSLNVPFVFSQYRVWVQPVYRQSLDFDLGRYGLVLTLSQDRL